jgi:hypothetical protein
MGVRYCTREAVKTATDQAATARMNARVDDAIESASRTIDRAMHRTFWPQTDTRYKDWPPASRSRSWVLWLDEDELISLTTLTAGGVTIPAPDYLLRPDTGPPFNRVEISLDSSSAWSSGTTHQRAVSLTGVFGYGADETAAGALAEALDVSETGVDVTDSAAVGVGDLLRVDSERLLVTGRSLLTTGQTGSLTASNADRALTVASGAAFTVGELLTLDAERVLVEDVAGTTLVVSRAADGTTLAAHTTATIYAPRTLTVQRGAAGTTAATHLTAAALYRHVPPGPISTLCRALAVCELQQDASAWARTAGSGDNEREVSGKGLAAAWKNADRYRRKARGGAV